MRKRNLLLILIALAVPAMICAQPYPGKIGVGVSISQWSKSLVKISQMGRAFEDISSGETVPCDTLGWPLSDARLMIMECWPVAEWFGEFDDPEMFKPDLSGRYHCAFSGQATLTPDWGDFAIENQAYDPLSNETTFDVVIPEPSTGDGNGLVPIQFTDTRRTPEDEIGSGITDFRMMIPGYDIDSDVLFNPAFIECIRTAAFSTIRTMGMTNTNNNNPAYPATTEWSDRRQMNDATFRGNSYISAQHGAPWELVIALANELDMDLWLNVPIAATDDYVRELAMLLQASLDDDLKIYVEWSNEVWNPLFSQYDWAESWASAQGLNYMQGYGKRTAEIALLFGEIFGIEQLNRRVRVVVCWQVGWSPYDRYGQIMSYIDTHYGPASDIIYGLGTAPYFNCGGMCDTGSPAEIINAMWSSSDGSVDSRQEVALLASEYSLPGGLMSYEGGSDTGGGSTVNVGNRVLAERDSLMYHMMIHDLADNWFPHGGGLFMYLEAVGSYDRYGGWGTHR